MSGCARCPPKRDVAARARGVCFPAVDDKAKLRKPHPIQPLCLGNAMCAVCHVGVVVTPHERFNRVGGWKRTR
jgi:hypothetical protein